VIGPVKPALVGGSNYTVLSCAGLLCSVQISTLGPQDPYGTKYGYHWSGVFGAAIGASPIVSLPVGTNPVQLSISDPTGVLVTAIQDIIVPMPAMATITPAQLAALTPAQLAAFTPAQLIALSAPQVASVVLLLTPAQVAVLLPAQLTALTAAQRTVLMPLLTPFQSVGMQGNVSNEDDRHDSNNGDDPSDDSRPENSEH